MFENPGKKIKGISKAVCWIGIAASVLFGGLLVISGANTRGGEVIAIPGVAIAILGPLLSWVGALMTYGLGTMVENSCIRTEIAARQALAKEENK